MPKFNEVFKQLRTESELSQLALSKMLGISKSSVNMYERGEREPNLETLELIADFYNVDMDFLLGKTTIKNRSAFIVSNLPANITPLKKVRYIPLLGRIACGDPILADENIADRILLPSNVAADFALTCHGDSMIGAGIEDGDTVFIRQQPTVENGEVAAVLIGDEATLKRVHLENGTLSLLPANPAYPPFVYVGAEIQNVKIIGKMVAILKITE